MTVGRPPARRLLIGLVDAGTSSVGNLAASVLAARSMGLESFGAFATAMLVLLLLTAASRSVHGDALVLLTRAGEGDRGAALARDSTASVLRTSAALGAPALLAGLLLALTGAIGLGVLVVTAAVALPLLCLQDHLRWVEYARGRNAHALLNNLLWTLCSTAGLLLLAWSSAGPVAPAAALAVWALAVLPGTLVAGVRAGLAVRPVRSSGWLSPHRRLVRPLLTDLALTQATAQGATLVIAALAGATQLALIRKGQIWMGPLIVLTTGLLGALQPVLVARRQQQGSRATTRLALGLGTVAAAACCCYGLLVLLLPTPVAQALVGPGWPQVRPFVVPLALQTALGLLGGCAGLALRAVGLLDKQVRWRLVLGPVSLLAVATTAATISAYAALWTIVLASAATVGAWVVLLRQADPSPGPATDAPTADAVLVSPGHGPAPGRQAP